MKNVIVTGGAGYIGSHVCKLLHASGFNPVVIDNLSNGNAMSLKWGQFFNGDLTDINFLEDVFSKCNPVAVIHLAAYAYVGESISNPLKYIYNNVVSSLALFKTMDNFGVDKVVFSSTCATYGEAETIPITEECIQNPVNPYGYSKLVVEDLLFNINKSNGLNYVGLRYFNVAGASSDLDIGEFHTPETHLIPLCFEALDCAKTLSVFGNDYKTKDGTCVRDYIHVEDLASAHLLSLLYLLEGGRSNFFNLGNGYGYSVFEIINSVERVTNKKVNFIVKERRLGDPPILTSSSKLIQKNLNWSPKFVQIDSIVKSAWNWFNCDEYKLWKTNSIL